MKYITSVFQNMLERAVANTFKLNNNISIVLKITRDLHICSHQHGDHCEKENTRRKHSTNRKKV